MERGPPPPVLPAPPVPRRPLHLDPRLQAQRQEGAETAMLHPENATCWSIAVSAPSCRWAKQSLYWGGPSNCCRGWWAHGQTGPGSINAEVFSRIEQAERPLKIGKVFRSKTNDLALMG